MREEEIGKPSDPAIIVTGLKCNYLNNPLGVETPDPRLSWVLESDERGQCQTAYQIIVAGNREALNRSKGDLGDSGKVESSQSIHVPYQGKPLESRQVCHWKVRVWDKNGQASAWSQSAYWETGLLNKDDWTAQWIGSERIAFGGPDPPPAPMLRQTFSIRKAVSSARAYVCGLVHYELYINGCKSSDDVDRSTEKAGE